MVSRHISGLLETHRILSSGHAADDRSVPERLGLVPNSNGSGTHGHWRDLLLALSDACAGGNTDLQSRSATHRPGWPFVASLFCDVIVCVGPDRLGLLPTV